MINQMISSASKGKVATVADPDQTGDAASDVAANAAAIAAIIDRLQELGLIA